MDVIITSYYTPITCYNEIRKLMVIYVILMTVNLLSGTKLGILSQYVDWVP